jgi:hypothetical protein
MKEKKFGTTLDISIHRANGEEENFIVQNVITNNWMQNVNRTAFSSGTVTFNICPTVLLSAIAGTFSQSGVTVTRQTGTGSLLNLGANDMFVFGSGQFGHKSSTGTSATFDAYTTQTVATTTLSACLIQSRSSPPATIQSSGSLQTSGSYLSGVVRLVLDTPYTFNPTVSTYTFNSLYMAYGNVGGASAAFHMPGTVLSAGDALAINSMEVRAIYDAFQPRAFAVSPLSGLTGTGRIQRLRAPDSQENTATTRIWLTVDASKYIIPDMIAMGATVPVASITPDQTLVATSITNSTGIVSNQFTQSTLAFGTLSATKAYKQILWGNTTAVHGVIEFDTPFVLSATQIITVGASLQGIQDHNFNF